MKPTFTTRYLDGAFVVLLVLYLIDSAVNLALAFAFFSTYLLRMAFAATALAALVSLFSKNGKGERYCRYFVIIALFFPLAFSAFRFLSDWLFYSIQRWSLLALPGLYLNFLLGVLLWVLMHRYSRRKPHDSTSDYGILICYTGLFLGLLILIRTIEPHFNVELNGIPMWETLSKLVIAAATIYLGFRMQSGKVALRRGCILAVLALMVYGLL